MHTSQIEGHEYLFNDYALNILYNGPMSGLELTFRHLSVEPGSAEHAYISSTGR